MIGALALFFAPAAGAQRVSLERVTLSSPAAQLRELGAMGIDVTADARRHSVVVVAHSAADRARLAAAGFVTKTLVADVVASDRRARLADARAAAPSALPSGRTTYRSLQDYTSELTALAQGHPGLVRRIVLPQHSIEGREITGVEIATNVNANDDGRPVYLVLGLHHAREWPSGEAVMEFAEDLVKNQSDPRIARILAAERIVLVPVVNPDGFVDSQTGDDTRRTNCRAVAGDSPTAPCSARHGVDLNRNYGAFWGGPGESPQPGTETYRGTGPWSEPESTALHEFSQGRQITTLITLHNFAGEVLWPPGWQSAPVPDDSRLAVLGNAMASASGYVGQRANRLYPVTGATEDWNYTAQGTFGYTIEMGGTTFHGSYQSSVIDQYLGSGATAGKGLREALLLAAEEAADRSDHAVLEGHAPAGTVLHLRRDFQTMTSPICSDTTAVDGCGPTAPAFGVADFVDTTLMVGPSGAFTWDIGPSTRPLVAAAGGTEAWTLSCSGSSVSPKTIVIGRGQTLAVNPCDAASTAVKAPPPLPRNIVTVRVGKTWRAILRSQGSMRTTLKCAVACTIRERLRVGSTILGTRLTSLRKRRTTVIRLHLSPSSRKLLSGPGRHHLGLTVLARTTDGQRTIVRRTLLF